MHGRQEDAVLGACIYVACREHRNPRPVAAVSAVLNVNAPTINSTYRKLKRGLERRIRVATPEDYVPYLIDQLSLSDEMVADAIHILNESQDIAGNPVGIAAAALYLAANAGDETITYREAGQAAGVTKETVWRQVDTII